MKKYYFLIIVAIILGLVLTGCSLLSNISQLPATEQSGVTYLTKNGLFSDILGLWHFDEGSGVTTIADSSGYGNVGTVNGATTGVLGNFGNALSFDGTDDYVDCGAAVGNSITTGKFTVEAWINGKVFQASYYDLIVFRGYNNWAFGVFRANRLMFGETGWTGYFSRQIYSDALSWTPDRWYHIAVVYDIVGKTADFYRDGVPVGVGKQSTDNFGITNNSGIVTISYSNPTGFNGLIDEVRIWNFALSQDQLGKVYDFDGFFRPVDNPNVLNVAKAGSAIPVKFSLDGDYGLDIFVPDYPRSKQISCDSETLADDIPETITAGGSSINYDDTIDQYIYVWKTDKNWTGTCRQLVVKLIDGTSHVANFKFK